ncbi:MAG: universal stress protein [Shewanella sp.]
MNRFKKILYVMHPHREANPQALARVISVINNNQAQLTLLRIIPKPSLNAYSKLLGINEKEIEEKILEHEEIKLNELLTLFPSHCSVNAKLKIGKTYIDIINTVQMENIDLVIKEIEPNSWLDRLFGSDDMHLLRKCPCPTWLMKSNEKSNYQNVMAAVNLNDYENEDGNNSLNQEILDLASSLALSDFASLHVVSAYDTPEAGFMSIWAEQPEKLERQLLENEYHRSRSKMATLLDYLKSKLDKKSYDYLSPQPHLVQGLAAHELPQLAEKLQVDIVVMGTVARTGIPGLIIGNTAESILSKLNCSVLAIKPKGFISLVK